MQLDFISEVQAQLTRGLFLRRWGCSLLFTRTGLGFSPLALLSVLRKRWLSVIYMLV